MSKETYIYEKEAYEQRPVEIKDTYKRDLLAA